MKEKGVKCSQCGGDMRFSILTDFKIGANSEMPGIKLPKLNEGLLPLEIWVCPSCGQLTFFAPEEIKQSLLRVADKRSR